MSARVYGPLALVAVLTACGPSYLSLNIKSPAGTNMSRPMYMLVRQVDPKQYANEAYSQVASLVGTPDPSVLQMAVIYPGTIQRFQVKAPKEGAVAVSFLFTAPDGNWQMLLSPQSTSRVDVELAVSRILRDSIPDDGTEDSAPPAAPEGAPKADPKMAEGFKPPEGGKAPEGGGKPSEGFKLPDMGKLLSGGGDK